MSSHYNIHCQKVQSGLLVKLVDHTISGVPINATSSFTNNLDLIHWGMHVVFIYYFAYCVYFFYDIEKAKKKTKTGWGVIGLADWSRSGAQSET